MEKKKSIAWANAYGKSFGRTKRQHRVRWLYGCTAFTSVAVFVLFWWTNVFRDAILSNLELRNNTPTFLLWQRPPVGLTVKVYVFNYTNVREFESGNASKLRVEEVGPYVYRETLTRVNVVMHENQTVTYQEKRKMEWISGNSEKDRVVVPNLPLMVVLAHSRNFHMMMQLLVTVFLTGLKSQPFLELPVGEYLWGYEDQLFENTKLLASFEPPISYDKFGILVWKNGLSGDRITVHTGADDHRNLGMIERVNGLDNHRTWQDEKCDRVYGTDGSIFPPQWVGRPNGTLHVYMKDFCRQIPLEYERRSFSNGIPTFRYALPSNVFTSSCNKDSCFCSKESYDSIGTKCPPAGLFNVSRCKFGTPQRLLDAIDGLAPQREHRESYIEIHPRLGITVNMAMKLQLNVEVRKAVGVPFTGNLKDGAILPLIWIDSQIEDLPESIQQILYRGHYLATAVEAGFQWCSLIAAILSVGAFIAAFTRNHVDRIDEYEVNIDVDITVDVAVDGRSIERGRTRS
ncbi:Scavenger receptor class B member 1 [Habropoda laboriosa]|uniref:Scavenger receptor class B member 1 n=1 Tax=Habropoda laboriosa TaxID=597456 RepID=A0A0L7RDG6_9HYME|nr:Scavenger receptor class B member 1 [Habropoda laboriosa]